MGCQHIQFSCPLEEIIGSRYALPGKVLIMKLFFVTFVFISFKQFRMRVYCIYLHILLNTYKNLISFNNVNITYHMIRAMFSYILSCKTGIAACGDKSFCMNSTGHRVIEKTKYTKAYTILNKIQQKICLAIHTRKTTKDETAFSLSVRLSSSDMKKKCMRI